MRNKLPILLATIFLATIAGMTFSTPGWKAWANQERTPPSPNTAAPSEFGQTAGPASAQSRSSAQSRASAASLIEAAVRAAAGRRTVSASIRQRTDLFGHSVLGSGSYQELHSGNVQLLRMEMTAAVDDQEVFKVVVCDGSNLWTYQQINESQKLTRVDARRALQALDNAQRIASPFSNGATLPALGGLERIIRQLDRSFEFDTAELVEWAGVPCWRLSGQWRLQQLAKLLPEQKDAIEKHKPLNLDKLPPQVPDQVVLYLGKDDLFPYRIAYCRRPGKGLLLIDSSAQRTIMALEFYDLDLSAPLDTSLFRFQPGNLPVVDRTDEFIHALN